MEKSGELYQMATLAEASYAEFPQFATLNEALIENGFSDTQSTNFVKYWQLAHHLPDQFSGF